VIFARQEPALKRTGGVAFEERGRENLQPFEWKSASVIRIVYRRLPKLPERTGEAGGVFFLSTFHLLHVFAHVARIASRLRDLNSPGSAVFNRCPPTRTVRKTGDWLAARRRSRKSVFSAVAFREFLECD